MTQELNAGYGTCIPEATTKVVAPLSWVEGGRAEVFAQTVFAAVHRHNREAQDGEFIAIDFPSASFRRDFAGSAGSVARLIGSRTALASILDTRRIGQFIRSTVDLKSSLITDLEPIQVGYAIVRSRGSDKYQPGRIRSLIRRNERNGRSTELLEQRLEEALGMSREERRLKAGANPEFAVFLDKTPFMFARRKAQHHEGPARVNTYGASDPKAPVIFSPWIVDNAGTSTMAQKMDENIFAQCDG